MKKFVFAAAALLTFGISAETNAATLYQSIPDLTVAPDDSLCPACRGLDSHIGQFFTLGTAATIQSANFVVSDMGPPFPPNDVTVSIFADGGGNTLGMQLYSSLFSTFASNVTTAFNTRILGVNLGGLNLAAGSYEIFFTNPRISIYNTGGPLDLVVRGLGGGLPITGQTYFRIGTDAGVILSDTAIGGGVPEPASWALMIAGFGLVGAAARRRAKVRATISFVS